jgi:hypothetical protein
MIFLLENLQSFINKHTGDFLNVYKGVRKRKREKLQDVKL